MAICQMMIQDFMFGWGRFTGRGEETYSDRDLEVGLQYAIDLKAEGHKKEPFHHYDLDKFIRWVEFKKETTQ